MKKAAVYDRWLHVLGGGERHTVAIAAALAKENYQVEVLTHRPTDLDALQKKFGFESLPFTVRYLPELWDYEITPYTKEYDLFVLSSFADIIPSKAKTSLMSVFFPVSLHLTLKEWLTRVVIVPLFRFLFQFPLYVQKDSTTVTVGTNKAKKKIQIQLHFETLALSTVEQLHATSTDVDVSFSKQVLHHSNDVVLTITSETPVRQWQIHFPESEYTQNISAKVRTSGWHKLGQLLMKKVPSFGERFVAGPRKFFREELESYDQILSNSKYTKKWIAQYWGLNTPVVYPPVTIEDYPVSGKQQKWIVSVGRFFVGGHSKKQLEMVEAFRALHKELPDWELHLVGSVNDTQIHRAYYEKVVAAAKDLPVIIHENASFEELTSVLSKSRIYWHATGLDIDEEKHPVMLEHFGLTVVEAMAAGCIPVVINKGGPAEIARDVGYTWNTLEELIHITKHLAQDSDRLQQFKNKAIEASTQYGPSAFETSFKEVLESCTQKSR